jgi:poly(hydroxyalkanoate) depolymerase family esterase
MTKSLTKLWLGGLKRLVAAQTKTLRSPTKRPDRPARPAVAKPSAKLRRPVREKPAPAARESRVGPRAAAWAAGSWIRSFHSAPPAPGRLVNQLSYALYTPAASVGNVMPLVVMLHGCQQDADRLAEGTRMNLLADRYGFAVVYPEQSKHAHAHRCWHWYDDTDHAGGSEARAVASLVDALVERYGFDGERVYVAGISAGAGLAMLLAVHYPERFAAVGLHSGPAFGEAHSGITAMDVMRRGVRQSPVALIDREVDVDDYPGMPAVIVTGDVDRVVSPVNSEQLAEQLLRLNGFVDAKGARRNGEAREERKAGVVTRDYLRGGRRVVRLCRVPGLGHAWAGGDEAVPFHSAKGPDASALVWEFFRYQRRSAEDVAARRARRAAADAA